MTYYPPVSFQFEVRVADGESDSNKADGSFSEVTGMRAEMQFEEVSGGGENGVVYKLPQHVKHGSLVLKRGLVLSDSKLSEWVNQVLMMGFDEGVPLKNLVVSLLKTNPENNVLEPNKSWVFQDAYPVKVELSDLNANNNEVLVESIEVVYKQMFLI